MDAMPFFSGFQKKKMMKVKMVGRVKHIQLIYYFDYKYACYLVHSSDMGTPVTSLLAYRMNLCGISKLNIQMYNVIACNSD